MAAGAPPSLYGYGSAMAMAQATCGMHWQSLACSFAWFRRPAILNTPTKSIINVQTKTHFSRNFFWRCVGFSCRSASGNSRIFLPAGHVWSALSPATNRSKGQRQHFYDINEVHVANAEELQDQRLGI